MTESVSLNLNLTLVCKSDLNFVHCCESFCDEHFAKNIEKMEKDGVQQRKFCL